MDATIVLKSNILVIAVIAHYKKTKYLSLNKEHNNPDVYKDYWQYNIQVSPCIVIINNISVEPLSIML